MKGVGAALPFHFQRTIAFVVLAVVLLTPPGRGGAAAFRLSASPVKLKIMSLPSSSTRLLVKSSDPVDEKSPNKLADIAAIALPALVSLAIDPIMNTVDNIYAGRWLGEEGLAALGLNTYIFTLCFFAFNFLSTVPTPLISRSRAAGDVEGAARVVGQMQTVALLSGFALISILELFGSDFLMAMGATASNFGDAHQYLQIRSLAAPAVLLIAVGNGAFRGYLNTRVPLYITVAANVLNAILVPVFLYMGQGVGGIAAATVASEWAAALLFTILLARKNPSIVPQWPRDLDEIAPLVAASSAVVIRTVSLQAFLTFASATAARTGEGSIAAHQLASQLWLLLSFVCDSLAVAAQGLVAESLGRKDVISAREVANYCLGVAFCVGASLFGAFSLWGDSWAALFTTDMSVLNAVAPLIVIVGVMQPLNACVFSADGVLQGSLDFAYEAGVMVVSTIMAAACVAAGGQPDSLERVWLGLVLLQLGRGCGFAFRYWLDPTSPLAVPRE
jgi:putative MATE family efflux protein